MSLSIEKQFQKLCQDGKLKEVKELWEKNPTINTTANINSAFRIACNNGHIDIVKWLFEIKPDIDIYLYKNYGTINLFSKNKIIIQYLHKIDEYQYLTEEKERIEKNLQKINEKIEKVKRKL